MTDTATGPARGPSTVERTVADAMISVARVHDLDTTVRDVRVLFDDDHLHAALILADGVLVSVVEPADLAEATCDDDAAAGFGTVRGRIVPPHTPLEQTRRQMVRDGRRRLAVVEADRTYRGLLCLKRSGLGFCSDADVRARAVDLEDHGLRDLT